MEITTHHAKGERVAARINVEVRFFFDWIALNSGDVAERNFQFAALVEAHFANPSPAGSDETAMPARDAANPVSFAMPQLPDGGAAIQRLGERFAGDRRWSACSR